jgi:hypothetical protein
MTADGPSARRRPDAVVDGAGRFHVHIIKCDMMDLLVHDFGDWHQVRSQARARVHDEQSAVTLQPLLRLRRSSSTLSFDLGPPFTLVRHLREEVGMSQGIQLHGHLPEEVVAIIRTLRRRRIINIGNGKCYCGVWIHAMGVELRVPGRI